MTTEHFPYQASPVAVLHASRRDDQRPQQSQRVDHDVSLASHHLFSPRRSHVSHLARSSSHFGCRAPRRKVSVCAQLVAEHVRATWRELTPTFHPSARGGSSGRRCDTGGNRGAILAMYSRCESPRGSHLRSRGASTLRGARQALVLGPKAQSVAIGHRSGR